MPSIIQKQRNSSIELYRIIATFTVLIVHFNGWFVEMRGFDFHHLTLLGAGQTIIESSTIICVNMFLIISGFFGIRLKLTSVIRLCLLLVLIYVPFYIIDILFFGGAISVRTLIGKLLVISNAGYFIQGYLMLMFFSPVLNSFVEKYGRKILPWTLIFAGIECWFESIREIENFGFNRGYSIIHFVLMYMVARCIALYKDKLLVIPRTYWLLGYVVSTMIICFMYVVDLECTFAYSNPVVIVSSICSFIPFLYRNWYDKTVNWIAGGTLAVYIIHCTDPVYSLLVNLDNYFLENYTYFIYLLLCGFVILLTFLFCVVYQKICESMVNPVINKLPNCISKCKLY